MPCSKSAAISSSSSSSSSSSFALQGQLIALRPVWLPSGFCRLRWPRLRPLYDASCVSGSAQSVLSHCHSHVQHHEPLPLLQSANELNIPKIRFQSIASTAGQLPNVLLSTFPDGFLSMSSARKACRKRTVLVDGHLGSCSTVVTAGQLLQVLAVPQEHPTAAQRQAARASAVLQQLEIAHMDEHLLVVVKPFGLHLYGRGTGHLKHWLGVAVPASPVADALPVACPVHRLDALTGGLVVCARTLTAARGMTQAFEQRRVRKQYRALLAGRLQYSSSTIDLPVNGKQASTQLQVVSHTPSLKFGWITTSDLFPETGRKHQLRIHMSAVGHPVLGDPLYNQFADTAKLAGRGLCLWAQQLQFEHPVTGQVLHVVTKEPVRFEKIRQQEALRYAKFTRTSVQLQH